ncbi:MFS transporter, partial [Bacillus subtilis]|uniref:MFS transporter n=1 Tax=Bacillus subtilis TaxID=1423 RepID=UPI003F4D4ED7
MPTILDTTNSTFPPFTPYLLFPPFPFLILTILSFTTPHFSNIPKLIYPYITYLRFSLTYTTINLPYPPLTSP